MAHVTPEQALGIDDTPRRLDTLEAHARAANRAGFSHVVNQVDWSLVKIGELGRILDLALSLDLTAQASELARIGAARFPDDPQLAQAARVLAPPVVRTLRPERAGGLRASQDWLRDHADAYHGQWVVVREGQLLGSAPTLADLQALLFRENDPATTIVTRIG